MLPVMLGRYGADVMGCIRGYLHIGHVDSVHITAFFLVHFDGDKAVIEQLGNGQGREGFPLHDMAPAARH